MTEADTRASTDGVTPGYEHAAAPGPLTPNGQHASYWILSDAERAKGFVRPVRESYKHVGTAGPRFPTRPLDAAEKARLAGHAYVVYEEYPEEVRGESWATGRYWTQAQLDAVGKGCGGVTSMGRAIAETYARDPRFYGSTFCVGCGTHLPVGAAGEFVWLTAAGEASTERVGT